MPVIVKDPTLPPGWEALYDHEQNVTYYWQRSTNTVTYEKPAAAAVAQSNGYDMSNGYHANDSYAAAEPSYAPASNGNAYPPATDAAYELSADEYRRKHDLTVQGDSCPDPIQTFEGAGFTADIMDEIRRAGYKEPTPIQAQSWPIAMQGRDLVSIAKTGSGKTCGFILPGLLHIHATRKDPRMGPTLLVLAPTRELAVQIKEEADKFGRSSGIRNTTVYGGAPKGPQLRDIQYGVQIVIATPGRLNDFLESRLINLQQVSYLVLDEADRMLDMGFEPQIQRIVSTLPRQRQTLFFSATWPKEVKAIAAQFVTNHTVHVFVGGVEEKLVANKAITQVVEIVAPNEKISRTIQILRGKPPGTRIIIFCSTKRMCDQLAYQLGRDFSASSIHGDKRQQERDHVLAGFKSGRMPIMVATDVAARGLDVKDVAAVINYDFPNGVEDYVHRIGRTGRAGATGEAYTFLTQTEGKHAAPLMKLMREAGQVIPPALESMASYGGYGGGSSRPRYGGGGGRGGGGGYGANRGYGGGGGFGGRGGGGGYGAGGGGFGGGAAGGYGGGGGYGAAAAVPAIGSSAKAYDVDRYSRHRSRSPRRRSRSRSPAGRSRRDSPDYGDYRR